MNRALILLLTLSFFSGQSQDKEEMLLGKISVTELRERPYSEWFDAGYDNYKVNEEKADTLKDLLDGVDIKIFMGTWCSDSRREVPRFYGIMDSLEFSVEKIELVAVDREKTTPDYLEKDLDIIRVPTLIFYREGEELGRIVEYPIESLEADMVRILSGKAYRHAYAE